MLGGIGLIACGVMGIVQPSLMGSPAAAVARTLADVLYAAAVLLLAFGLSRAASVVGRRPLGLAALTIVAVWPLINVAIGGLLASDEPSIVAGYYYTFSLTISVIAAVIAAVQIGRAGIVPAPWHWAPMWALGVRIAVGVAEQIAFVALGPADVQQYAGAFVALSQLTYLAGTLGLGIIALVAAARLRPESVDVFRSS